MINTTPQATCHTIARACTPQPCLTSVLTSVLLSVHLTPTPYFCQFISHRPLTSVCSSHTDPLLLSVHLRQTSYFCLFISDRPLTSVCSSQTDLLLLSVHLRQTPRFICTGWMKRSHDRAFFILGTKKKRLQVVNISPNFFLSVARADRGRPGPCGE
jgi:hypothetical protein